MDTLMNGLQEMEIGTEEEHELLREEEGESGVTETADLMEEREGMEIEKLKKENEGSTANLLEEGREGEGSTANLLEEGKEGEGSTANLLDERNKGRVERLTKTADLQKVDGRVGRRVEEQVEEVVVDYLEKGPLEMGLMNAGIVEDKIKALLNMQYGRRVMNKTRFELWRQLGAFMGRVKKGETEWRVAVEWETDYSQTIS